MRAVTRLAEICLITRRPINETPVVDVTMTRVKRRI